MLREALIAASESRALRHVAEDNRAARAVALRFVAGETLDDALAVAEDLRAQGYAVSLDYLGESVDEPDVARRAGDVYLEALDRLEALGADANVSVKPSQLGVGIDPDLPREVISTICERAAATGGDVTVDMEGSDLTEATVELVLTLRGQGHDNVGCAVQSYLRRTPGDVARLTAAGASLRLCKGAYAEPADVAFQDGDEIDAAYLLLADTLLTSGTYPRVATHDHRLIHQVKNLVRRYGLTRDDFEFQMLHGVREPLQRQLVEEGWRLRVYVPFGEEWYPYFMRRIAERPANLVFMLRAVAGRRARG